jgi:hypothetical protein
VAEKTVELPGFHAKIDAIDRQKAIEPPRQLRSFDGNTHVRWARCCAVRARVIAIISVFGVKSIEVPSPRQSQSQNEMNARQYLAVYLDQEPANIKQKALI